MAHETQRVSVRVMLGGVTLLATGRFARGWTGRAVGPEPDWLRLPAG